MSNLSGTEGARHLSLQNIAIFLLTGGVAFQNVPALAGVSVFEMFFLIATLFLLLRLASFGGSMRYQPHLLTNWFFFTFAAFALPAVLIETPRYILTMTFTLSSGVLALFVSDTTHRMAAQGALLSGLVLAVTAIGQLLGVVPVFAFSKVSSFRDSISFGYTGLIPSRGAFGIVLMTALTFFLATLSEAKSWFIRTMTLGGIAVIGLAAVISFSRSTIVAFFVVLISFAIFHLSSKKLRWGSTKRFRCAFILLPSLVLLASSLLLSGLVADFLERLIAVRQKSVDVRFQTMSEAIEQLPKAWLLGTGSDINETLNHMIHNAYLAVLVERGVFGFTGFFMLNLTTFFVLLRRLFTTQMDHRYIYSCLLAGFLGVQTELMFFRGYLSIPYWIFFSIVVIYLKSNRFRVRKKL